MNVLTYTSFRENLADALERVEKGETIEITRRGHQSVFLTPKVESQSEVKTVKFADQDRFDASLKRIQKKHAKNIQALADR
ncbi:MAG: type II toxin-antitoxin system prevent-host-death family antitoxin [Tatlockia sp.]|nr:type II toxin-antitoxin system prevent-host-death family antitoxin [Tatlockia sp.]